MQPGWTVLLHSAAGGVGQLAVQWLKHLGATVIGTVGSPEKAELARAAGADHVILYRQEDIAARVREITDGVGVPVVIDGVGADSWQASLSSTAKRGVLISYGSASGPIENIDPSILGQYGSLFLTRPTLFDYYATPEDRSPARRACSTCWRRACSSPKSASASRWRTPPKRSGRSKTGKTIGGDFADAISSARPAHQYFCA